MIITTTGDIEGHTINPYLGIVAGAKGSMLMVIAAGTAVTLAN